MGIECSPYVGEDDYEYEGDREYDDESYDDDDDDDGYDPDDDDGPMSYPQEGDDYMIDGVGFADPGGRSALRAATKRNPRDCTCPQCGAENVLTRIDRQHGYVCDPCADENEGGMGEY